MRITLTIDDETYEKFKLHAQKHVRAESIMQSVLTNTADMEFNSRYIVVDSLARQKLEEVLAVHVHTALDLVDKVKRLADLRIGNVNLPLSPSELTELKERAKQLNLPFEDYLGQILDSIKPYILNQAF